jgi:cell division transport system permease protein
MSKERKPTQFYATVSTTIVLILIALFLLVFFHSNNITNIVKENINILVELEDNLPSGEVEHIKKVLSSQPGVISSSVKFISKAQALEMMSKELLIAGGTDENPFKDLLQMNLDKDHYSDAHIKKIKATIELEKGVVGLYYENDSIDMVKSNVDRASLAILLLALCFVILALAIIFNTVKLTLYADMKLIKTMQMVGAEKSFIKKPYLKNAFNMIIKAVAAVAVFLALLCGYLIQSDSIFAEVIQWPYVGLTLIISFFAALFIQFVTTNSILNEFLSKEGR